MSKKKTLNIRYGEVVLFVMSMVNLLYMHYYVFYNQCMEVPMFVFSPILNVLSILIDISIFFLVFYSLSLRRFDLGLWLTYLFTLLWSFSNTFYCRFFSHYLSLSAIGQAGSLTEGLVVKSMVGGFQYWDFFYVFSFICVLFYCCFSHHRLRKVVLHTNLARLLLSLICFPIFARARFILLTILLSLRLEIIQNYIFPIWLYLQSEVNLVDGLYLTYICIMTDV